MKKRRYSDEEFIQAVKTSTSIRQVLHKLNLKEAGGNYILCKARIKKLGLETTHLTGQSSNKGQKFGPKRPIEDYFDNKQTIQSHKLKQRLIKDNILERACTNCCLYEWLDKPIPLELHHIDGNSLNNNLSNLELLCPNCHAFTSNYRGKGIKNRDRGTRTPTE